MTKYAHIYLNIKNLLLISTICVPYYGSAAVASLEEEQTAPICTTIAKPNTPNDALALAHQLARNENHKKACEIFEAHRMQVLNDSKSCYIYAESLFNKKEYRSSTFYAKKALELDSSLFCDASSLIGKAYYKDAKYKKAIPYLEDYLIMTDPSAQKVKIRKILLKSYHRTQNWKRAFKVFEDLIEQTDSLDIKQEISKHFYSIGADVAYQEGNIDKTLEWVAKSIEGERPNIWNANNFAFAGDLYHLCQVYDRAIVCLNLGIPFILDIREKLASLHRLGDAYYAVKNNKKAHETYRTYLSGFGKVNAQTLQSNAGLRNSIYGFYTSPENAHYVDYILPFLYNHRNLKSVSNAHKIKNLKNVSSGNKQTSPISDMKLQLKKHYIAEANQIKAALPSNEAQLPDELKIMRQEIICMIMNIQAPDENTAPNSSRATSARASPSVIGSRFCEIEKKNIAFQKTLEIHKKSATRAKNIELLEKNVVDGISTELPSVHNVRSQFGHEKLSTQEGVAFSSAASSSSASSASTQVPPTPQVRFILTGLAIKHYSDLAKQKKEVFFEKIQQDMAENPRRIGKGFGQPKHLKGDSNLFSRHLNYNDRIVYRVHKDDGGAFTVEIISILSHYKKLNI